MSVDILFIYPPTGWSPKAMNIAENDAPPIGLLYVAAAARRGGLSVAVLDLNHPTLTASETVDAISRMAPRIIAFSVLTTASASVKRLVAPIKSAFPGLPLVAGGIHATVLPEDLLKAGIDFVVRGEGEERFYELARAIIDGKPVDKIPGVVFRDGSAVVAGPRNVAIRDLDALAYPARDLVPLGDYGQAGAICGSRGCPYSCSFCSSVLSQGHLYRTRATAKVVEEMDSMHAEFGTTRFQFFDDNFTADVERAAALSKALLSRSYVWACQTTVMELAGRLDVLDLMFEAGCREVYFGLETGSRRLMQQYKGLNPERALVVLTHAASRVSNGNGHPASRLQTVAGFILGHPEDDEQSIEETVQFALTLRSMGVDTMMSIMQPYPGSLLHRTPARYGVTIENTSFEDYLYPKANLSTRHLSRERIRDLYAGGLLRIMRTYETGVV